MSVDRTIGPLVFVAFVFLTVLLNRGWGWERVQYGGRGGLLLFTGWFESGLVGNLLG